MASEGGDSSCLIRLLMVLGMVSMSIGMGLFYSFGMYAVSAMTPFIVAGLILVSLAGCLVLMQHNYIPRPTPAQPQFRDQPPEYFISDSQTLNQIAEAARAKGILVERPSADNPNEVYRSLRCPTCRYLFDIGRAKVVGVAVICPSCEQEIGL